MSSMLRSVRKESEGWQEGGAGVEGAIPRSALGWRGAREELADFSNPSFINVKPSSAECGLTDITELLTTDCLQPPQLVSRHTDLLHESHPSHSPGVQSNPASQARVF